MDIGELKTKALTLSQARDWDNALRAWEELRVADRPTNEVLFRIAEAQCGLENFDKALAVLDLHDHQYKVSMRTTSLRARICSQMHDYASARDLWRKVATALPDNYQAWARLAEASIELGERAASRVAVQRALAINANDTFVLRLQKRLALQEREAIRQAKREEELELAQAIEAEKAKAAVKVAPPARPPEVRKPAPQKKKEASQAKSRRRYTVRTAFNLSDAGRWSEAAVAWLDLLEQQPDDDETNLHAWEALHRAGRIGEARTVLSAGLLKATSSLLRFEDAVARASEFELPDALADGLETLLRENECAEAIGLTGVRAVQQMGKLDQSIEMLDRLVTIHKQSLPARSELVKYLYDRRDFAGLVRRSEKLLEFWPPKSINAAIATICYQLGLALLSAQRVAKARELIDTAWDARPVGQLALRAKASLLIREGRIADIEAVAREAFRRVTPQPWPWLECIRLLLESEYLEEAVSLLSRAVEAIGKHPNELLAFADRLNQVEIQDELFQHLDGMEFELSAQYAAACRIAAQRGYLDLATRFLDRFRDDKTMEERAERLAHRLELAKEIVQLAPKIPDWRFEDAVLWYLGDKLRNEPVHDDQSGPILLVNSAMGAGGAERQIAVTLSGFARKYGNQDRFKLVCSRLTNAPERRFNLGPVVAAGVEVVDLMTHKDASQFIFDRRPELREYFRLLPREVVEDIGKAYRLFDELRPSVVHLWQDRTSVEGALAAIMAGVPSIVMVARSTRPLSRRRYRGYLMGGYTAILQRPNVILANNSMAGAADYESWLGLEPGTVKVIHNGYDFDAMKRAASADAVAALREKYGIASDTPVLGGVLRFAPVKRPMLWLDVARLVADAVPDLKIMLLGEGPLESAMRDHAARLGIADRLIFTGFADPAPHYPLMSAILLTSETEGLPNVLLEAQAFGVPAISTDVGGARETVIENTTGFIVGSDVAQALADKTIRAIRDGEWRSTATALAGNFAHERFSIDAMLQKTLDLYDAATSKSQ